MIEVVELAVLLLPPVSVNAPRATDTEPDPLCVFAVGVNTTVYTVEEVPVNDDSVPPLTVMSPTTKFVDASDKVIVSVDVWPDFNVDELAVIELTDGAVVSIVTVRPVAEVDVTVESLRTVDDCAVTTLSPAVSTPVSHDHAPVVEFAVQVLPEATPSTYSWTVAPTGAEPVNVNVVADVMLSVDEVPKSSVASRSGVETSGTAYRSTTTPEPPAPPEPSIFDTELPPPPPFPVLLKPEVPVVLVVPPPPAPPAALVTLVPVIDDANPAPPDRLASLASLAGELPTPPAPPPPAALFGYVPVYEVPP